METLKEKLIGRIITSIRDGHKRDFYVSNVERFGDMNEPNGTPIETYVIKDDIKHKVVTFTGEVLRKLIENGEYIYGAPYKDTSYVLK